MEAGALRYTSMHAYTYISICMYVCMYRYMHIYISICIGGCSPAKALSALLLSLQSPAGSILTAGLRLEPKSAVTRTGSLDTWLRVSSRLHLVGLIPSGS
jgi:hypothetical protein